MTSRTVELSGGSPWGFRMHGGVDVNQPLRISRRYSDSLERILDVNPGRKAALSGIREGDVISSINNVPAKSLTNAQAHAMLKNSGDILKLGLNEDSVGSPRRRSVGKSNGLELKRPSQIIAETQGKSTPQTPVLTRPESKPSFPTTPNIEYPPQTALMHNSSSPFTSSSNSVFREIPPHFTSQNISQTVPSTASPFSLSNQSLNNISPNYSSLVSQQNGLIQQISPSKFDHSPTAFRSSPFENELNTFSSSQNILTESKLSPSSFSATLTLRSPPISGSSPSKTHVSPIRKVSPFASLESTSFVKSSIRPSITMPTITPPTISFPAYASSESDCNRISSQQYNAHNLLNSSTSSPFPTSLQTSPNLAFSNADLNTTHTSLGYIPTYNTDFKTSPRSPISSMPYIPASGQMSSTNVWSKSTVSLPVSSNSTLAINNGYSTNASHSPPKDLVHNQFSSYFPLSSNNSSVTNSHKPLNTTASTSPFTYPNTLPTINSAPISSTLTTKTNRQSSPFNVSNASNNKQSSIGLTSTPSNPKSSLSSMQFPHYLLYSTPTTTIKSTNPFITNEYLVTKTEISEQSITETEEVTTTKKMSLNGYEEPSSQAFDKALSALRMNGGCNAEVRQNVNDGSLTPFAPYNSAEKPPRTPQDFSSKSIDDKKTINRLKIPTCLKELCLERVASLPFGTSILEELASASKSLKILTESVRSENWKEEFPKKMPYFPSPDLSAVKKAALVYKVSKQNSYQPEKVPPPVNPRQSSFKILRDDPPWIGLATNADPTLLACLSPSQKRQIERSKNTANDEAGELIDMHCKYVERRGYHETYAKVEKSPPVSNNIGDNIPVPVQACAGDERAAAACSPGSTNRLLAIIRDPQLNPDAKQNSDEESPAQSTFNFKETLRSFEDLNEKLAQEEKNISISKKSEKMNENVNISEMYSSSKSLNASIKKTDTLLSNNFLSSKRIECKDFEPINKECLSKDYQSFFQNNNQINHPNKSNSNTVYKSKYHHQSMGDLNSNIEDPTRVVQRCHNRRAFLLDDPIFDAFSEKVKQNGKALQNGAPVRRSSLPKDLHDRQIAYILQKEKEIEDQIKQLEDQKRITHSIRLSTGPKAPMMKESEFSSENYNISRKRDIAIIQQEMEDNFESNVYKIDKAPLMVSMTSNGEKFRDQMYFEYMDKVAEREERKNHKVIKISNSQDCPKGSLASQTLNDMKQACNKIEEEFISKAKLRWDKLGFKDPETETEDENEIDLSTKSVNDNVIATENQSVVIEHKIKVIEGDEEKDVQKLPNHLQEFVKFTSSGDEAEIVMIAPTFKAKASSSGVWSPGGSTHTASPSTSTKPASSSILSTSSIIQNGGVSPHKSSAPPSVHKPSASFKTEINESSSNVTSVVSNGISGGSFAPKSSRTEQDSPPSNAPPPPPLPPLPIWKPGSQPPSPAQEKKQFKPVSFESPTLARKNFQQEAKSEPPPPWESRLAGSRSAPAAPGLSGLAAPPAPPAPPTLPRAQNPTITLLQKAREGQLPRGAAYLQQERERDPPRDRRSPPRYGQGEPVYSLRRDYASDTESSSRRKMVEPQKYDGIGPTTKEGMPIVLRSEVKEGNQSKWYKKMYDTIHRNKFDAHPSALHPGPRTNQYAYFDPRSGYLSEPEGGKGWVSDAYDSDASAKVPGRRHSTLDRRGKENEVVSEYMPSVGKYSTLASAKASQEVYKNQPGRIEDYIPGRSSVVDKEAKQWWDEVMDIFDGQLANASVNHPQINNKQSVSTSAISKSYMARALKESGYESDSTLVFRRRGLGGDGIDGASSPLSPREQRQAYREVQAGGEPPLQGFRKPAPDRPKESPRRYVESDVNIHYRVPVRQEPRPLVPEEELARRQADHMRRVYQEERRRKYLQELQDMNSRRHTDNFTPAQKSPISLNRYDTFGSTGLVRPHQIARALHNFTGQSTRELSFRRGDLLLVRRRIDQNWFEGECDGQVGLFPTNYVEMIDSDAPPTPTSRPSEGRARAKFNFVAQTHLELGLKKGELVTLLRRVDDNWYEGKLGGRKGIFPVSYVEVLVEPQPNRAELTPSIASGKPVASPAAHSVVGAAGAASLGAHHYTPLINNPALSNSPSSTAPLTLPSHGISNHHARPASATLPRASDPSPINLNNHEPLYVDTNAEAVPYRAMYKYRPQNPDELELQEGDTVYVLEKCDDGWYVGSSQRTGRFGTFPGNYVEKI